MPRRAPAGTVLGMVASLSTQSSFGNGTALVPHLNDDVLDFDADPEAAGKKLRQAREALGLSQSDVAKMVGVLEGVVGNWERGGYRPKHPNRVRLAKVLGIRIHGVLTDDSPDPVGYGNHVVDPIRSYPMEDDDDVAIAMRLMETAEALNREARRLMERANKPPTV